MLAYFQCNTIAIQPLFQKNHRTDYEKIVMPSVMIDENTRAGDSTGQAA